MRRDTAMAGKACHGARVKFIRSNRRARPFEAQGKHAVPLPEQRAATPLTAHCLPSTSWTTTLTPLRSTP